MPQPQSPFREAPAFSGNQLGGHRFTPRAILQKLIGVNALRNLYARATLRDGQSFFDSVLRELDVTINVTDADLRRIPEKGPIMVCANHPFGILDGMILGAVLLRVRPDVRILTNLLLAGIPELQPLCFWVDPFQNGNAPGQNRRAVRRAVNWLRQGGLIATFPAGEVAHWRFRDHAVCDPAWTDTAVRIAGITGAGILPVHFVGRNSVIFQSIGYVHPRLRTLRLPGELLNKSGSEVDLRIGHVVPPGDLQQFVSASRATAYVRARTEILPAAIPAAVLGGETRALEPVAPPQSSESIVAEITSLARRDTLAETDEFLVVAARASEIPVTLQELGRQREIAFRAEGEGTGMARDLDRFDRHYTHLLLWSKLNKELAGAYRLGLTGEILPQRGPAGLYTSELFDYDQQFFQLMGDGLEVGRSFIKQEYQKQFAPLMLLWRGIGSFVERHPEARVLFGPVSVSASYTRVSRELTVRYFERRKPLELASLVTPRCPVRASLLDPYRSQKLAEMLNEYEDLSSAVSANEPDGKPLPILLTQYVKLGGRVLSFNLDRAFSDVVDALIYVDLRQSPERILSRYMSKQCVRTIKGLERTEPCRTGMVSS